MTMTASDRRVEKYMQRQQELSKTRNELYQLSRNLGQFDGNIKNEELEFWAALEAVSHNVTFKEFQTVCDFQLSRIPSYYNGGYW